MDEGKLMSSTLEYIEYNKFNDIILKISQHKYGFKNKCTRGS